MRNSAAGITEPPWLRYTLSMLALTLLLLLVGLPLVVVLVEALRQGVSTYSEAFSDPDAWAALRLTLLVAVLAVPLNLLFGLAAAWACTRFQFRGKAVLSR